jgi:hypothetical protein
MLSKRNNDPLIRKTYPCSCPCLSKAALGNTDALHTVLFSNLPNQIHDSGWGLEASATEPDEPVTPFSDLWAIRMGWAVLANQRV